MWATATYRLVKKPETIKIELGVRDRVVMRLWVGPCVGGFVIDFLEELGVAVGVQLPLQFELRVGIVDRIGNRIRDGIGAPVGVGGFKLGIRPDLLESA